MKLGSFTTPNPDNVPPPTEYSGSEFSEWVKRFFEPLSRQVTDLTRLCQGKIDSTNENAEIRTIDVTHNVPVTITLNKVTGKAKGAWVLACSLPTANPGMTVPEVGKVTLTPFFEGTPPSGAVSMTFKIVGES